MKTMAKFIFKSTGHYSGFIMLDGNIFSRDGVYLGWIEEEDGKYYAWDTEGQFRGILKEIDENRCYILKNIYSISPVPKQQKPIPSTPAIPAPPPNIPPTSLSIGVRDAF